MKKIFALLSILTLILSICYVGSEFELAKEDAKV